MQGCTGELTGEESTVTEEQCQCAYDEIAATVPYDEFQAYSLEAADNPDAAPPEDILSAMLGCMSERSGVTARAQPQEPVSRRAPAPCRCPSPPWPGTRVGDGEGRPALAALGGQLVHEGDGARVLVARAGDDRAVGDHAADDLAAEVGAHDGERPVVVLADAAGGDVGVLGGEVGAVGAALARPGVALLQRDLVVGAVLHPDLEDALDVHLHDLVRGRGRTWSRTAPRRSSRRRSSSTAARC